MSRGIDLFMFGYQETLRIQMQSLGRSVLEQLGIEDQAYALLVGARAPGSQNRNPVCVEPEDGRWDLAIFNELLPLVEERYDNHELKHVVYGDAPSMRDKPEWMRRDSVTTAVRTKLEAYDSEHQVTSFCGSARLVDQHYVVPVLQLPHTIFDRFVPLPNIPAKDKRWGKGYRSLIHAAIDGVLAAATAELERPEPGRFTYENMRNANEIVAIAADRFMVTPGRGVDEHFINNDLFKSINLASSLLYEGIRGVGDLILVDPDNEAVEFSAKFSEPVPLSDPRWIRKVLQMAASGVGVICDGEAVVGLGGIKKFHDPMIQQDVFTISFLDHYLWELHCGDRALMRSHYGIARLVDEPLDKASFLANHLRLFPSASQENALRLWGLVLAQARLNRGSMIVVAEDAASEAERLKTQGTQIEPVLLTPSLLESVSGIDGTIIVDPHCVCYAVGMILDGNANPHGVAARGSRFNSAIRYVYANPRARFAIVVSDDRTLDVIPPLIPLVSRTLIERHVSTLEASTGENYHDSRNWLQKHRFYLNAEQCRRANTAVERIDAEPREWNRIHIKTPRFEPHPKMEDAFLVA